MAMDNRVYFDTETGKIISMTGEADGNFIPLPDNQEISYIDIPFGSFNYQQKEILGVNPETRELITTDIDLRTEEQKKIEELEEQLLLLSGVI